MKGARGGVKAVKERAVDEVRRSGEMRCNRNDVISGGNVVRI